uniref:DMSO reductase anchor subunit DmsC n=1 Tax=uncultured bacterium ws101A12 TaxID=1131826 RepID=I1X4G0_9BACT|nr:DMSO reductase anchor subunit DmsC [uncultured bacterium ws101A12]
MHPAPSVILFTVLSGLGFGLLAWLGIGRPDVTGGTAFAFYVIGYGLAVGGLLFSTLHLANRKNAIKSFSQWRTSWLSREAVLAVAALLAVAPYAIGRIFFDTVWPALGVLGTLLCLATVASTAMIYTQLKTVPRWNTPVTPALFLAHALAGGALLAGQTSAAIWLLVLLGALMLVAWIVGDARWGEAGSSMETATGLGRFGRVRLLEPPHAGENYLLKEMAYRVGRKHAQKLRVIAILLAVAVPFLLLAVLPFNHVLAALAVLSHLAGALAARWLFFAEARHVQALYYGK